MLSKYYFNSSPIEGLVENLRLNQLPVAIFFLNSYNLALCNESESYKKIVESDSIRVCDGWIVSKLLFFFSFGRQRIPHIRGADFMKKYLEVDSSNIGNHFLLGSTESVLETLSKEFSQPDSKSIRYFSPAFTEIENIDFSKIKEVISNSGAKIVWVGMGTPKQDYVCRYLVDHLNVTAIAVGAAFNFLSGDLAEAPKFIRLLGAEWLFRLFAEPGRLWKRYLVYSPKAVHYIIGAKF